MEPLIVQLARRRQRSNIILPDAPVADFIVDLYDAQLGRTPIRRVLTIIDDLRPFSIRVGDAEVTFEEKEGKRT